MAFMEPEVSGPEDWIIGDSAQGGFVIPADVVSGGRDITADDLVQYTEVFKPEDIWEWEIKRGFGVRLSAPGYMDSTPWDFYATRPEANERARELNEENEGEYAGNDRGAAVASGADPDLAVDLVTYIDNVSDLSLLGPQGQGKSVMLNALRRWRKGTYDPAKAVTLFGYLTETGAKRYHKEFHMDGPWNRTFSVATRRHAATLLEEDFRGLAERGELDHVDTRIGR